MVVKHVNDPNLDEVVSAGTYADSPAVTSAPESCDLYGADGYKAELNLDLDTKKDLFDGQQKRKSEFADENNKDDKQKALFRCQIAFTGAANGTGIELESIFQNNIADIISADIETAIANSLDPERAREVQQETEALAKESPEAAQQLQDHHQIALRNEQTGEIIVTQADYDAMAERLQMSPVQMSQEEINQAIKDGDGQRRLENLDHIRQQQTVEDILNPDAQSFQMSRVPKNDIFGLGS